MSPKVKSAVGRWSALQPAHSARYSSSVRGGSRPAMRSAILSSDCPPALRLCCSRKEHRATATAYCRSALVGAVKEAGSRAEHGILIQPMSICYTGLNGIPMGRQHRSTVAWYGRSRLHAAYQDVARAGAVDAVVSYGDPVAADSSADRKVMAKLLEDAVRQITSATLRGRPQLAKAS